MEVQNVSLVYLSALSFCLRNRRPPTLNSARLDSRDPRRYTAGILRNHRSSLITADGAADHLHVLASLHPGISVSKGVQLIKSNSSRWLSKEKGLHPFAWQESYGAFTVSRSQKTRVQRYIDRQEEHHRKRTFDEELLRLFEAHGLKLPEDWRPD